MSGIVQKMRLNAAKAALAYIQEDQVVGVGSGNTSSIFIQELATIKHKIAGAVASSVATAALLKSFAIPVLDLTNVDSLPIYVDSADAFNDLKQLIKGGGGALTREKILAQGATKFICIVDTQKQTDFAQASVPVEVIPMARSIVAHELVKLGGNPEYRNNFVTDNGNIILDVKGLQINQPIELESKIKQITGVVDSGIFAKRRADIIIIGNENGVREV